MKVGHHTKAQANSEKQRELSGNGSVQHGVQYAPLLDSKMGHLVRPDDLLTPAELAERLKVSTSWVFEQTRNRAKVRNNNPLPCIRLGKYLRFSWPQVCQWMAENSS